MKKKLEADLISIAHRILQLKNRDDISVLQEEARKLYEKLSVLKFIEEHFESGSPTIGKVKASEILEKGFDYDDKVIVGSLPAEEESAEENHHKLSLETKETSKKNISDQTEVPKEMDSEENKEKEKDQGLDDSEDSKDEKSIDSTSEKTESEKTPPEENSITFNAGENLIQPEVKEEITAVDRNEVPEESESDEQTYNDSESELENPVPAETSFEINPEEDSKSALESAFSLDFEPAEKDNKYDAPVS